MSKYNDISRSVKFSHGKIANATLDEFVRQYTNVVHWCVNRLLDSDGAVDKIWLYSNAFHLNKVMILDGHLINCAVKDSIAIYESYSNGLKLVIKELLNLIGNLLEKESDDEINSEN